MSVSLPDIYLFNPTCEYAVANGRASWQPNRILQKMEEDLTALPAFLAGSGDIVLVRELPPEDYISRLKSIAGPGPRFVPLNGITQDPDFLNEPKNRLLPWGWSPAAHRLLSPLKTGCASTFKHSPVASWMPGHRELYSKKFALEILKDLLPLLPPEKILPPALMPRICTTKSDLETLILKWGKIMVKAPWSSSGRGLQRITKTPVAGKVWEKLLGIIHTQGYAMAEPLYPKILDMAFQFEITKGKISYLGISRFITDKKGQYQGNYLNGWPAELHDEITAFAESVPAWIIDPLITVLGKSRLATHYEGHFGVDTLIYRDDSGSLRLHPCLEINVRQNMGLLSLRLHQYIAPETKGLFKIFYQPGQSFRNFRTEMEIKYPLILKHNKILSGFFPLTPAQDHTQFGAWLLVTPRS